MVDQNMERFFDGAEDAIRKAAALVRMKYGGVIINIERHSQEVSKPNSGMREFEPTGEITITVKRD